MLAAAIETQLPRHCSQAVQQQVWNEIGVSWEKIGGNATKINRSSQQSDPTRSPEKALAASSLIRTSKPLDIKPAAVKKTDPRTAPSRSI